MASPGLKDIDEIDDIEDMIAVLKALNISRKGLKSLDEMKALAIKSLSKDTRVCPKVQSYNPIKAFTILLEARAENARKRKDLLSLFSRANDLLGHLEKEESRLLPQSGRSIRRTMEHHIDQLERENVHILVAGETSAGKSSLINLILGEEVLPSSFLATTSVICELKYGKERQIVLHYKEADSTKEKRQETFGFVDPAELQKYVGGAKQKKCSDYEKIEIFLPHQLLEKGIAIVDSPGIGETKHMTEMVTEYLTQALAFVYVINTPNSGGVKEDRIEELLQVTMRNVFEKIHEDLPQGSQNEPLENEFQSNCALFLCNKWEYVLNNEDANPDEVKEDVIRKLKNCWPGLVTEDQVFFMSVKDAKKAAKDGRVSDDFVNFMNSMGSMIFKSCKTRLEIHWRWLYHFLLWISYWATSVLKNKAQERIQEIRRRLDVLEKRQSEDLTNLRRRMDDTVHEAVLTLTAYLKSDGVRRRFGDWTEDEVRKTFEEKGSDGVVQIFQKELRDVINKWEEDQFKSTKESLLQQIQHTFDCFESELCSLRGSVAGGFPNVPGIDPLSGGVSFLGRVYVKLSWFVHKWILPFSSIFKPGFLSSDSQSSWKQMERSYQWSSSDSYDEVKQLSAKYLSAAAKESFLKPFVKRRLHEAEQYLSHIETLILEHIEAEKRLLVEISDDRRSKSAITTTYQLILKEASDIQEKVAFFGLREAGTANICSEWLDLNQGSYNLVAGKFSSVYQGKMTRHGETQTVALRVFREVRLAKHASRVIQEANQLSKLNHPHLVKFYGTAVVNEKDDIKAILVMELCKGNLENYFKSHRILRPRLPPNREHVRQAFKWVIEICSALDYIHNKKVVHRDLKLEKILLSEDNTVKLYDVSVCKEADSTKGKFKGTPRCMAPEVLRFELNDFKADIYSFGIMLWEIWFGQRAFDADRQHDNQLFINLVSAGGRPREYSWFGKPPPLWKELMEECWHGDPEKRPTAKECEQIVTKLSNEWSG